jgi:hypothetical protein
MIMKNLIAYGILTISALLLVPACSEDSEAGRTVDCASICSSYSECVTDIDEVSCATECEDKADVDSSYQQSASQCETCIDGKACAEAEPCWDSCPAMPATTK